MAKKRAFSYIRMSTEMQLKGHSLERQLELTREYAKENDLELIESLQDIGLSAHSGANVSKGQLGRFLTAISEGEIEKDCVLIVENLDRLSRQSPRKAFQKFNNILDYGIEIHTIFDKQVYTSKSVDDNPGQLFASIGVMLRAYSESEDKSIRLKKKWAKKRDDLANQILTTVGPAWLEAKEDGKGFRKVPDRCKTIKKIFDLCIDENKGTYAIATFLNSPENRDKYPRFTQPKKVNRLKDGGTRTGWQKSYIMKILNNPSVHGEFQPHFFDEGRKRIPADFVLPDYYPAVISKERFALAQARLKERKVRGGGRKGESFNNIFTKLLKCGSCGASIYYKDKGESPKGGKYLVCGNRDSSYKCKSFQWRYKDFEEDFFNFVRGIEFDNVLKKPGDKSRLSKLIDDKSATAELLIKKEQQLNGAVDSLENLSDRAKSRVYERIEKITLELDELDIKKREIDIELSEIEERDTTKTKDSIIAAIKKQEEAGTPEEQAAIRRRIHNEICKVVEKITIFSGPSKVHPWEVIDQLSPLVKKKLAQEGLVKDSEIESFFANEYGAKLFNECERYFIIAFKNKSRERVHPYLKRSWQRRTNKRLITFIENRKKRTAEQELKAKRKALKEISVKRKTEDE